MPEGWARACAERAAQLSRQQGQQKARPLIRLPAPFTQNRNRTLPCRLQPATCSAAQRSTPDALHPTHPSPPTVWRWWWRGPGSRRRRARWWRAQTPWSHSWPSGCRAGAGCTARPRSPARVGVGWERGNVKGGEPRRGRKEKGLRGRAQGEGRTRASPAACRPNLPASKQQYLPPASLQV